MIFAVRSAFRCSRSVNPYAAQNRYADTTASFEQARARIGTGQWKLPIGSMLVVDDADRLDANQLGYLTEVASGANAKLLLVTNTTGEDRDTNLTDMLVNHLPWAQRPADPTGRAKPSVIDRVEHHLADTTDHSAAAQEARDLLTRRDDLSCSYHDLTNYRSRSIETERDRSRSTDVALDR